jgi:hypothetical protein
VGVVRAAERVRPFFGDTSYGLPRWLRWPSESSDAYELSTDKRRSNMWQGTSGAVEKGTWKRRASSLLSWLGLCGDGLLGSIGC